MYLVLCAPEDSAAKWACESMRTCGLEPVELVTSDQLAYGRLWEHRIGRGPTTVRVELGDGRSIRAEDVSGGLNRLVMAPMDLVRLGRGADREYATQELSSFYLSWLHALPAMMVGRPEPGGYCGRWRHISEWAALAHRAGLRAPVYRQSASSTCSGTAWTLAPSGMETELAIACKGKLFGMTLPDDMASGCLRLAELAESDLLGVHLFRGQDGLWNFATATPCPDFRSAGMPMIEHLICVWTKGDVE